MKAKMKNKIIALARNDKFYTGLLIGSLIIGILFIFLARFIAMWMHGENLIVVIIVGVIYFTIFLFTLIKGVAAVNYYFSEKLNK